VSTFGLRMPLRFLRGNYTRVGLTVVALACGVAQVSGFDLVAPSALQAFVDIVDTVAGRASLQVSTGQGGLFSADVATTVAAVPGVELTVPMVSGSAFTVDGSGELLAVQGLDVTNEKAVSVYELYEDEGEGFDDPKLLLPNAVVLTHAFADHRGLKLGDPVEFDTPRGRQRFIVRGLLEPRGVARLYQGNLIVMDISASQHAFAGRGLINRLDVVVERNDDVTRVADAITAVLPPGLRVETPVQREADLHKAMRAFALLLRALDLVGLGAAFLISFNGLTTVFEARAWQLGVLRAVGVSTLAVWSELLKESVLLGAVGVVLGIPMGIGLAWVGLPFITTAAALASKANTPDAHLAIRASSLALGAVVGLTAALSAAALPAWRAARREIVETVRGRGAEQPAISVEARWVVYSLVAAALVTAIAMQIKSASATWGLVATVLTVVVIALAARPLMEGVRSPLARVCSWLAGPSGRFATAYIARNPRRNALTIAMLGVGLACVLWLWTVAQSFERTVVSSLTQSMRADVTVSSAHIESGFLEAPVDEQLLRELKAIPGVSEVSGDRVADWHYGGGPIALDAFDPRYFNDPTFGRWPLLGGHPADVWEAVARGEAVVASSNFVLNLGAHVGDVLTLDTPNGPLKVRVGGVITHFLSPRGTLMLSRELYQRYWNDRQVTRVFVRVSPGVEIAAVRAAIVEKLGRAYGLRVLTSAEIVEYFASQARLAFAGVYVLAALVLFVVLVGISDTLAAGVIERTREIGAIRVVGVQRQQVRRMVLIEGVVLGMLGLALAVGGGLALGTLWVDETFPRLFGWVLDVYVPYAYGVGVALTTLAASLAAAHLPARRAASLEPAVALRYE
jgi:putative ABC transport system permease protein